MTVPSIIRIPDKELIYNKYVNAVINKSNSMLKYCQGVTVKNVYLQILDC